jgi:hypothetical protein
MLAPAAVVALAGPAPARAADVLPDLDERVPQNLSIRTELTPAGRTRFHLGFDSAAANVGDGPLALEGHRADRRQRRMAVDQLVDQDDGSEPRLIPGVGRLAFVKQPDHRHWHYIGFQRYEVRRADGSPVGVRRDRKSGFCLGDRYRVDDPEQYPGFNPSSAFNTRCGLERPDLLSVGEGISVGYGDDYVAHVEGQYVDVTRLGRGTYLLVHRVNADGRLLERDTTNDAASVRFRLTWPHGPRHEPRIAVRRACPDTATCP